MIEHRVVQPLGERLSKLRASAANEATVAVALEPTLG
jgi:hypothetical protein